MSRVIGNLSLLGFLDGITATGIILSSVIFGFLSFYHARKVEAKLLAVAGITMIFVGCLWLGPATDFFFVLLTGSNLEPEYLYGWLSYMWIAPATIAGFYLGGELMMPKKKWLLVGIYTVIGIIFEIILFTMPIGPTGAFQFNEHGEGDLIDSGFNRINLAFWIILFLQMSVIIFLVIGFALKAKQSTGELRKKFLYLSLGFFIFIIAGIFDSLMMPGVYLVIWRGLMMTYALWMFLGLKT